LAIAEIFFIWLSESLFFVKSMPNASPMASVVLLRQLEMRIVQGIAAQGRNDRTGFFHRYLTHTREPSTVSLRQYTMEQINKNNV